MGGHKLNINNLDASKTATIGAFSFSNGSAGASNDYQVLTTNATDNPNGIFFDTAAVATSNIKTDQISGLTGTSVTVDANATFNSNVDVTGNITVTGDVNITGQINSTTVNNLNINDF